MGASAFSALRSFSAVALAPRPAEQRHCPHWNSPKNGVKEGFGMKPAREED